jgi:hypothetical protein
MEMNRIANMKHCKTSYLKYLFEEIIRLYYWYNKQGVITEDEEKLEDTKRDIVDLYNFINIILGNIHKFDPQVFCLHSFPNI